MTSQQQAALDDLKKGLRAYPLLNAPRVFRIQYLVGVRDVSLRAYPYCLDDEAVEELPRVTTYDPLRLDSRVIGLSRFVTMRDYHDAATTRSILTEVRRGMAKSLVSLVPARVLIRETGYRGMWYAGGSSLVANLRTLDGLLTQLAAPQRRNVVEAMYHREYGWYLSSEVSNLCEPTTMKGY
jgi:hypothetical protein